MFEAFDNNSLDKKSFDKRSFDNKSWIRVASPYKIVPLAPDVVAVVFQSKTYFPPPYLHNAPLFQKVLKNKQNNAFGV